MSDLKRGMRNRSTRSHAKNVLKEGGLTGSHVAALVPRSKVYHEYHNSILPKANLCCANNKHSLLIKWHFPDAPTTLQGTWRLWQTEAIGRLFIIFPASWNTKSLMNKWVTTWQDTTVTRTLGCCLETPGSLRMLGPCSSITVSFLVPCKWMGLFSPKPKVV